jgi:hypothetical protein
MAYYMQLPEQPLELIRDLNRSYELELAEHLGLDQLEALLAEKLNNLIRDDFNALVQWLYRVDIDESKLKRLLSENIGQDAGRTIARLVMERQWQKMETRRQYRPDPPKGDPEW